MSEDDSAHVTLRDHVVSGSTMLLALRFSEAAREECLEAERALLDGKQRRDKAQAQALAVDPDDIEALRAAHLRLEDCTRAVLRLTSQACRSLDYLMRTTSTLEGAIRLYAAVQR